MMNAIKKVAATIASCGPIGYMPLGMLMGSLLAYPALYLFSFISAYAPPFAWWLLVLAVVIVVISVVLTLKDTNVPLVADKVLGLMLANVAVSLSFKLIIIGYLAFHLCRVLVPLVMSRFAGCNLHERLGMGCVLVSSLLAGVVVNVILRTALWIAR